MDVRRSDVIQSCPTLCNPMDCRPPGSSIHGILQARILEWVTISCPVALPDPGIELGSPALQVDAFKLWATREAQELDYKESWALKNWWFWTVMLEKTLESPLDCKEMQLVHPKGNQSWIFVGITDGEVEVPILCPPVVKNWLLRKDPDAGRLKAGEGDDRGWDSWIASLTQWTWIWTSSGSWWWTGKPGVWQSIGLHIDATEMNWTELNLKNHGSDYTDFCQQSDVTAS